ncbi:MAG: cupin domain-containing protein [Acidimicrobiales bacterium]
MTVQVTASDDGPRDQYAAEERLRSEGLAPHAWGNGPGERYSWHRHEYHKVLYCVSGGIVFHTEGGEVPLQPGDRMDLPGGTDHAATVGPQGVQCVEAARAP